MKVLMMTGNGRLLDGINRHVLMVAGGLQARGVEVAVCTVAAHGELAEALEAKGIKVFALGCETGHDWRLIGRFWKVMRSFRPDVVHVHMSAMWPQTVLHFAFGRVPRIQTLHILSSPPLTFRMMLREPKRLFPWWVRAKLQGKTDRFIFVSQGLMEDSGPLRPAEVIYNPMSFELPPAGKVSLRTIIGVPEGTPVIGTACRIAKQKNPQSFVRVMLAVLKGSPEVHAVVMGIGVPAIESEMRALVKGHPRLHFLGYRADAPSLTGELSCFIMTSLWEGLPTALLEAVRARVPIAFMEGGGGLRDLARLNAEEGPLAVVVPQGDEAGLAQGILQLLAQPEEAKARVERAYAAARKRYSIELAAEALESLYRRVIEEAKA